MVDVKLAEPSWPVMPEGVDHYKVQKTSSNNHAGPGVEDFDRENAGDPQQHSDYAMETFQYYKNREETFRVPDYLQVGQGQHSPQAGTINSSLFRATTKSMKT